MSKKAAKAVARLEDRTDLKNPKNKLAVRVVRNSLDNGPIPRGRLVESYMPRYEYTMERGEAIARELGMRSLVKICDDESFLASIGLSGICSRTIIRWARKYPEFGLLYHEAWTTRLEIEAHRLVEISDDDSKDMYGTMDKYGNGFDAPNPVSVSRATLRINTRMSLLRILHPKFKDKPSVNLNVSQVNALNLTPDQIRETLNMAAEEMNRLIVIEGESPA